VAVAIAATAKAMGEATALQMKAAATILRPSLQ